MKVNIESTKICIVGLGYVGLPLAVEFGKKYETVGVDVNQRRIDELQRGVDSTLEVEPEDLASATMLSYANKLDNTINANVYIVTVPTPIDHMKQPNLKPLQSASSAIGKVLKKGDVVIYESTVFPGCTEEVCVPILEKESGLIFNSDFSCGYSPERINPGDKVHTVSKILKVTSGSNPKTARFVDDLYKSIITAGTYLAESIKVAESAKIIENCQRDINIAFVNELALIFDKLNIDTSSVLEAAGTKWNFLPFKPGLVGGHCIGVDPYYLTYKAEQVGYNPQVILSGRRINDNMGMSVANRVVKLLINEGHAIKHAKALILGITFKENCPDIRNSKVIDVITELEAFGMDVDVYDPWASKEEVFDEYGIKLIPEINSKYNAVILAVAHNEFVSLDVNALRNADGIIFDIKSFLDRGIVTDRL